MLLRVACTCGLFLALIAVDVMMIPRSFYSKAATERAPCCCLNLHPHMSCRFVSNRPSATLQPQVYTVWNYRREALQPVSGTSS